MIVFVQSQFHFSLPAQSIRIAYNHKNSENTYGSKQCAAVSSHRSLRMVPPQRHLLTPSLMLRWTIHGHLPFVAGSPPTMLLLTSAPSKSTTEIIIIPFIKASEQ